VKVYLATAGEYSDYRVLHVFARREDAESYPLGEDVEEREVRDGPVEVRMWHELRWAPHLGDRPRDSLREANPVEYRELKDFEGGQDAGYVWSRDHMGYDHLRVDGWDPGRVRKVYSEQRAQYLARQEGI
jgi:hypothetical protein